MSDKSSLPSIDHLKLSEHFKDGNFDVVSFRQVEEPENSWVDFKFAKFPEAANIQFDISEHTGFPRWIVMLWEKKGEDLYNMVYFHAYFGDPLPYAKNNAKAGNSGFMVKCSKVGYITARKLAKDSEVVKKQIEIDLQYFSDQLKEIKT